ncbi:MAG: efflux RND transporter permease subunit, partial [Defluviitaleaceae bacterium]|nr:efflux RND transporter permease subunit [Defluviitaleaceae bacterium]
MNFAKFSVRRPVATVMAILVVMVFGFLSIRNINLDMFPNMDIPIAFVITSYSGVGSAEIESLITIPLEGVLGTVSGVSEINSSSSYGSSQINVQFEEGVDINFAALEMRERLDMIRPMLPADASDPIVMQIDMAAMNQFQFGVKANDGDLLGLRNVTENQIINRLERIDGVAQVTLFGGIESEIEVLLHEDQLRGFGISESTVISTLRAENASIPAGSIREGDRSMSLRVSGEFNSLMDIENIPFFTPAGALIYLRDFAQVQEVLLDDRDIAYINGVPALGIFVQPQSTANTVNVSGLIEAEINQLSIDFPNFEFAILMNPAEFINQSIDNVVSNAMWGGIFAVLVL